MPPKEAGKSGNPGFNNPKNPKAVVQINDKVTISDLAVTWILSLEGLHCSETQPQTKSKPKSSPSLGKLPTLVLLVPGFAAAQLGLGTSWCGWWCVWSLS